MSIDREQVERIKEHFARKISSQLNELIQSNDRERWSAEAFLAAEEVLSDRAAGRAEEPLVGEDEPPPPELTMDSPEMKRLFFSMGLAALGGSIVIPYMRRRPLAVDPDLPVPFGFKMAWLALSTRDTARVAAALGLKDVREATWKEGIGAAHESSIYVTPPIGEFTLAVGKNLQAPEMVRAFVKPLLERLSREFGDAQYFCTHRVVEFHVWARASKGQLKRGYGYSCESGLTLWNEGQPAKEERELGFEFVNGPQCEIGQGHPELNCNVSGPNEKSVMELASLWSIDPTTLGAEDKEQATGLLGLR